MIFNSKLKFKHFDNFTVTCMICLYSEIDVRVDPIFN